MGPARGDAASCPGSREDSVAVAWAQLAPLLGSLGAFQTLPLRNRSMLSLVQVPLHL